MNNSSKLHFSIGGGFAIVWLIMTVIVGVALLRMTSVMGRVEDITGQHNVKIALIHEMRSIIYQRNILMRDNIIYSDLFEAESNRAKLLLLAQEFVNIRTRLQAMPLDSHEQRFMEGINAEIKLVYPATLRFVDMSLAGEINEEVKQLARDVSAGQNRIADYLAELAVYQSQRVDKTVADTLASYKQTRILIIILGGVAAILNLLVAYLVMRRFRHQTDEIELLARFPSENPRPVMRIRTDGNIVYANTASRIFLDTWESDIGHLVPADWRERVARVASRQVIEETEVVCLGRIFSMVLTPVPGANYVNVYGHDITEREQIREQMAHLASHDSLTGLINRRQFEQVMEDLLQDAVHRNSRHAFVYFDLDQFKLVNDTCGHVAGDELLKQLSAAMYDQIRSTDTLARLGGDEFGLLLPGCSLTKAQVIADTLRKLIESFQFAWEERTFHVGASMGVVSISRDSGSINEVLSEADTACYLAKEAGRNRVHVSYPGDTEIIKRVGQMEWVPRIRQALTEDRFQLFCQDIVDLSLTQDVCRHGEILLRLNGPDGGQISPAVFIPVAERYDLMAAIDRWVIEHALPLIADQVENCGTGSDAWYSVNLSGQSIGDADFLEFVTQCIESSNVPPGSVCFEITETAAISNLSGAREFIARLKALGCRFALDDFGSGLSSFSYLQSLHVDYLKIDGSIVKDMHSDRVSAAMVEAITRVAHEMDMGVIAEWVEHAETTKLLTDLGVEYAQGFALAEPRPMLDDNEERQAARV